MKTLLFLIGSFLFTLPLRAIDNPADAVLGTWKNGSGKGHVQIFKQNGKYYGKITWLRDANDAEGKPKVDRKNANPSLRSKPLIGLVMLRDFTYNDGEWSGGRIYNPSDGKEYKGNIRIKDPNTLLVRGYIGFSFFGKTDTWTRVG